MRLSEIASLVDGEVCGDPNLTITGIAPLHLAEAGQLAWVSQERYRKQLASASASAVLVERDFAEVPIPTVRCDGVERALAIVIGAFAPPVPVPRSGVHPSAVVDSTATLGKDVAIGPHVSVEAEASIGDRTVLHAGVRIGAGAYVGADGLLWHNVVVRDGCCLGDHVVIHPNAVVGSDGFGFYFHAGRHHKIPHAGGVVVGDDVEIGACTCIDRSKTGMTRIGDGVKIDNLVQVAHNVGVGAHCLLCAQVGVAGSTQLGDYVVFGGQSAVRDNVVVGDGVMVAAAANVAHDVSPGSKIAGTPAVELRQFLRECAVLRKLPQWVTRLKELVKRVDALEASTNDKPDR